MNYKIMGLALATAFTAGTAQAASITETSFFGTQGSTTDVNIGLLNETISINGFNSSLGLLTNVSVEVFGQINTAGTSQNTSTSNGRAKIDVILTEDWSVSSASADNILFQAMSHTPLLSGNSGAGFTLASGDTFAFSESTGELSAFLSGVILNDFVNTDVDFLFQTKALTIIGNEVASGTGSFSNSFSTASWGRVEVIYTYDNPNVGNDVPEPAALALMTLGLGLMGFVRKK